MKLLEKSRNSKLIEPLNRVTINNLFARSVIEHSVSGKVYADNCDNPKTYYVIHPYGMSPLYGDSRNKKFHDNYRAYAFNLNKTREKYEWMQAFVTDWDVVLNELFKDCIIKSSDTIENTENGTIEYTDQLQIQSRQVPKNQGEK